MKRTSPAPDMTDQEAKDMGIPEHETQLIRMICTRIVTTGVGKKEDFDRAGKAVADAIKARKAAGEWPKGATP